MPHHFHLFNINIWTLNCKMIKTPYLSCELLVCPNLTTHIGKQSHFINLADWIRIFTFFFFYSIIMLELTNLIICQDIFQYYKLIFSLSYHYANTMNMFIVQWHVRIIIYWQVVYLLTWNQAHTTIRVICPL